jgi:hypothetical protein
MTSIQGDSIMNVRRQTSETTRTAIAACRGWLFCAYFGGSSTSQHKPMVSELGAILRVDMGRGS